MFCGVNEMPVATKLFLDAAIGSFPHASAHYFLIISATPCKKLPTQKAPNAMHSGL
jgi:hypothetical protein